MHNHMLGGGFGRRLEVDFIAKAVEIAKQVDGPVKVIWSREEDVQHDMYRPYFYTRLHAGLKIKRHAGRVEAPDLRILDRVPLFPAGLQGWLRLRHRRWRKGDALFNPQRAD